MTAKDDKNDKNEDYAASASSELERSNQKMRGAPVGKGNIPRYKKRMTKTDGKLKKYVVMEEGTIIDGQWCSVGDEVELTEDECNGHREQGLALQDVEAEKKRDKHPTLAGGNDQPDAA